MTEKKGSRERVRRESLYVDPGRLQEVMRGLDVDALLLSGDDREEYRLCLRRLLEVGNAGKELGRAGVVDVGPAHPPKPLVWCTRRSLRWKQYLRVWHPTLHAWIPLFDYLVQNDILLGVQEANDTPQVEQTLDVAAHLFLCGQHQDFRTIIASMLPDPTIVEDVASHLVDVLSTLHSSDASFDDVVAIIRGAIEFIISGDPILPSRR